jgi:ElaB/YqjD/DUF883 family membrane-anchored ribosome-binding protein
MSTKTEEPTRQSRASAALGTAGEKLQDNPMAAIAGGLALGVLIGTLLPRSEREAALLGGLGSRIGDAARDAYDAARATGQEKLDELGLTKDGARDKVKTLLDGAIEAASAAGTAAKGALRGGEQQ